MEDFHVVQSSLVSDIEASFLSRGTAVNSSLNSRLLTCHQWPNQWCIQKSTHGPMELQVFIIIQKRQIAVRAIFCVQSDSENTKHISDFLILLEASIMGNLIIYYDQM